MSATTSTPTGADQEYAEIAAALRSGERGLTKVCKNYGPRLFDYAMGLLAHREAAEDAVHDALLVAVHRVGQVQRPTQLVVWLYALTRNECLRQARRGRKAPAARYVDTRDHTVQFGSDLLTQQARAWVRDAAAGLQPREREALDLVRRHQMDEADVAAILGIPTKRASALVSTAAEALERTLDVLFTSRAGHGACATLDEMLAEWDGRFTQAVRDRVSRHMGSCRNCAPVTWDYAGAVELFAELPQEPPPGLLARRVIATAGVPSRVASRADIAEPFDRAGFPVPLDRTRHWRPFVVAASVVIVLALAGTAVWATRPNADSRIVVDSGLPLALASEQPPSADGSPPAVLAAVPEGSGSASASASASPSPTRATPSPSVSPAASASASAAAPSPTRSPGGAPAHAGQVQVDALFADSTVGCPLRWQGAATTYVRGSDTRDVAFYWGTTSAVPNAVSMSQTNSQMYQATVTGMPNNATVYWHVVAVLSDGEKITTSMSTIDHRCTPKQ